MVIGIDGNEANVERKVGVHQYSFEILWALYKLQDEWKDNHTFVIYLKDRASSELPKGTSFWKYKVIPRRGLWVLARLTPSLLLRERPDVFFSPHHYLPIVPWLSKVCMIHDLGYLKFSGQFKKYDFWQLKVWSAISVFISKCIICPSQSVKKDIVRHFKISPDKVNVVYHGYDRARFSTGISSGIVRRVIEKYGLNYEYILFLGTLKPSKNVEGLIEAFARVGKSYAKTKLVIAGKKGWLYESIFEKVEKLGLSEDVVFMGFISEKDKPGLIAGARVFAMPSFWEGFGMDALNAMALGTIVVVSNQGSLPEVVGGAGIYIDPYKIESLERGLSKALSMNENQYKIHINKGLEQVKKFSWETAARETLKVLEGVK